MRKGGEKRGNTRNRRARKLWLLATFDPELGDDMARCRLVLSDRCLGLLDFATRSTTFAGIARAMAEQWGGDAREVAT